VAAPWAGFPGSSWGAAGRAYRRPELPVVLPRSSPWASAGRPGVGPAAHCFWAAWCCGPTACARRTSPARGRESSSARNKGPPPATRVIIQHEKMFNNVYSNATKNTQKTTLSQQQISVTQSCFVPIQTTTVSVEIRNHFCRLYFFLVTTTFF